MQLPNLNLIQNETIIPYKSALANPERNLIPIIKHHPKNEPHRKSGLHSSAPPCSESMPARVIQAPIVALAVTVPLCRAQNCARHTPLAFFSWVLARSVAAIPAPLKPQKGCSYVA